MKKFHLITFFVSLFIAQQAPALFSSIAVNSNHQITPAEENIKKAYVTHDNITLHIYRNFFAYKQEKKYFVSIKNAENVTIISGYLSQKMLTHLLELPITFQSNREIIHHTSKAKTALVYTAAAAACIGGICAYQYFKNGTTPKQLWADIVTHFKNLNLPSEEEKVIAEEIKRLEKFVKFNPQYTKEVKEVIKTLKANGSGIIKFVDYLKLMYNKVGFPNSYIGKVIQ